MSDVEAPAQRFTYKFYDVLNLRYIADLPLTGVTFGQRLNTAGSFKGDLSLADARIFNLSPFSATMPSRTLVIVDLGGTPVWGGIIWTRAYQQSQRKLNLGGLEAWSYFTHRVQARDYTTDWQTIYTDPLVIAETIVRDALNVPGSAFRNMAINLEYDSPSTPGNYVTASFPLTSLQTVDGIVANLAGMGYGVGFDFGIDWTYGSGGIPTPTLTLAYPRRGHLYQAGASPLLDVSAGGNVDYQYPEDGGQQANKMWVTASLTDTSGSTQTSYTSVADNASIAEGYPLLEAVSNYPQINSTAQMTALCAGDLATYKDPLLTPVVDSSPFGQIPLGSFKVGDDIRLVVPDQVAIGAYADERFPGGAVP